MISFQLFNVERDLHPDSKSPSFQWIIEQDWKTELRTHSARYVVVGVCEDMGILANGGKSGARSNWFHFLQALAQHPSGPSFDISSLLVLGHFEMKNWVVESDWFDVVNASDREQLSARSIQLADRIHQLTQEILQCGKTPVVIGGSHCNLMGLVQPSTHDVKQALLSFDHRIAISESSQLHDGSVHHQVVSNYPQRVVLAGIHTHTVSFEQHHWLEKQNNVHIIYHEEMQQPDHIYAEKLDRWKHESKHWVVDIHLESLRVSGAPFGLERKEWRMMLDSIRQQNTTAIHISGATPRLSEKNYAEQIGQIILYLVADCI